MRKRKIKQKGGGIHWQFWTNPKHKGREMFTWDDPFKVVDVWGTYKGDGVKYVKKAAKPTLTAGRKKFLTGAVKNQAKIAAKMALLAAKNKFLTKEVKDQATKAAKRMIKTGVYATANNFINNENVQFKTKEVIAGKVGNFILDRIVGMVSP